MTKKQEPVDGTAEEWIPKTAHEVAVGMFHGLPNILVPARHHLAKMPGAEAKTVHKAVNRALEMVSECTAKFARVPGPVRANFKDEGTLVVVETDTNRVTIDDAVVNGVEQWQRIVRLLHRVNSSHPWDEIADWDVEGNNTEAILGVIAKVIAGVEVTPREIPAAVE